ncbi:hypothetical protein JQ628_11400 [Bradyrhizobium lablabi]|uniref:hypothetical protein n=1 Tax=Bradyrhizobium lablabi TaxID=722472 RepID=UPI001BACB279|nr:hypothetical protein [Bradyrhizobium lablabi]MBR1122121.1 hypothetical protein [Bradyrhizobium lablabi]
MLSSNFFVEFNRSLAEAVIDINEINRMGIFDLRKRLADIPGGSSLTMGYGAGGRSQIFNIGDRSVEVGPTAGEAEIRAALASPFLETKKKEQSQ